MRTPHFNPMPRPKAEPDEVVWRLPRSPAQCAAMPHSAEHHREGVSTTAIGRAASAFSHNFLMIFVFPEKDKIMPQFVIREGDRRYG
jgi:hypothetical protein